MEVYMYRLANSHNNPVMWVVLYHCIDEGTETFSDLFRVTLLRVELYSDAASPISGPDLSVSSIHWICDGALIMQSEEKQFISSLLCFRIKLRVKCLRCVIWKKILVSLRKVLTSKIIPRAFFWGQNRKKQQQRNSNKKQKINKNRSTLYN